MRPASPFSFLCLYFLLSDFCQPSLSKILGSILTAIFFWRFNCSVYSAVSMWFCCCRERLVLRTRDGAVWRLWIATSSAGKAIPQTASSMRWRFPSQCARQVGRNSNLAKSSNAPAAASNRAKSGHGIFRNAPICVVLHPFCALCPRVQCVIIPKTLFAQSANAFCTRSSSCCKVVQVPLPRTASSVVADTSPCEVQLMFRV